MEQLRVILEYVRKYHFWLLCVVAVVASLIGWLMARGTLSEEYSKRKSTVDTKFSALEQIQRTEFPPNQDWATEIARLTEEERKKVTSAWQTVYDQQQKVLLWPEVLGEDIIRWINSHKPDEEIPEPWRIIYWDRVVNVEFPKLLEIVDAKMEGDGDERANPAVGEKPNRGYKVAWESESQQQVKKSLEMRSLGVPTPFEVRLKQEDLWVFKALLNIIRATNEGSVFTSRVKQINAMSIGVEAAKLFQEGMAPSHIDRLQQASTAEPQAPGAAPEPPPSGEIVNKPDEGRYVSSDGAPLPADSYKTQQFKRLPVYMRLVMDQREIPRLLTECANSPLPVEVKQLRINPKDADSTKKTAPGDPAAGPSPTGTDLFDVTVEIHGIIDIYNPPDPTLLGQPGNEALTGG